MPRYSNMFSRYMVIASVVWSCLGQRAASLQPPAAATHHVERGADTASSQADIDNMLLRALLNIDQKIERSRNDLTVSIFTILETNGKILQAMEKMNQRVERLESMLLVKSQEAITEVKSNVTGDLASQNKTSIDPKPAQVDKSPLCDVHVPPTVSTSDDAWREQHQPADDALDQYMAAETGCTYMAMDWTSNVTSSATSEGPVELHFALRADSGVGITLRWSTYHYMFVIGFMSSEVLGYEQSDPPHQESVLVEPGMLSRAHYEPFYLSLRNHTLTLGKLCDSAPLFTRDIGRDIPRGEQFQLEFLSGLPYGLKVLYECPRAEPVEGRVKSTRGLVRPVARRVRPVRRRVRPTGGAE